MRNQTQMSEIEVNDPMPSIRIGIDTVYIDMDPCITAEALDAAIVSRPFQNWKDTIASDKRLKVEHIFFQSIDMFKDRVGFIKFNSKTVVRATDELLPGIVFMRGGSVAILVVLECEDEEYALLVKQPRVATGCFDFIEVVAGMLDDAGSFAGAAAKELKEEADITITETSLIDLTNEVGPKKPIYLSPGASDEAMRFFLEKRIVSRAALNALRGKLTGNRHEHEYLTLEILPLHELRDIANAGTQIAYLLYLDYKRLLVKEAYLDHIERTHAQ